MIFIKDMLNKFIKRNLLKKIEDLLSKISIIKEIYVLKIF